jgi:hypothetical protein
MRVSSAIVLATLALPFALTAAAATQAAPYDNNPVCLRVYGPVRFDDCRYVSIEQCQPAAQGIAGQCVTNPWYQPPTGSAVRHRTR